MQKYANYHGDSGVVEFNITNNAISINFKHGKKLMFIAILSLANPM